MQESPDSLEQNLQAVNLITSLLSLTGCCILYMHIYRQRTFNLAGKSLILLNTGNLLYTIANFFSPFTATSNTFCQLEGFLSEFGSVYSIYWSACSAALSYKVISNHEDESSKRFFNINVVISFFASLLISILPFFNFGGAEYEPIGYFCWVGLDPALEEETSITWNIILLVLYDTGPILFAFGLILKYQIQQVRRIKEFPPGLLEDYNIATTSSVKYPIAFLMSFLFGIIDNWALYIFGVRNPLLAYAHIAISNCFGLLSAMMYGGLSDLLPRRALLQAKSTLKSDCNFSNSGLDSSLSTIAGLDEPRVSAFWSKSSSRRTSGMSRSVIEMIKAQDVTVLDADP